MIVDISMWKPFRVGDLFDIQKGKRLTKADMVDGNYPFVGASAVSNGVTAFVGNDAYLHDGHCLTVCYNGSVGETFLQKEPFWASDDVNVLRPFDESVSDLALMFVAPCIRSLRRNYGYTNKWTSAKMAEDVVLLPATSDGEPDWAYMEAYMQQVLDREAMFAEHLASLTAEAVADGHVVDTSAWKAFRVGDLFEIYPTVAHKITNAQLMDDGDNPVVVNSSMNNGIGGFTTQSVTEDGGIITFSDTTNSDSIFYQAEPFVGYPHVQGMHPFDSVKWSDMSLLFFVSTFRAAAAMYGFSYSNKFRRDVATNIYVMLPATPDGAPDWAYMERYMRDVMAVEALFADELDRLSRE